MVTHTPVIIEPKIVLSTTMVLPTPVIDFMSAIQISLCQRTMSKFWEALIPAFEKKLDFIVLSRYAENGLRRPTLVHDLS